MELFVAIQIERILAGRLCEAAAGRMPGQPIEAPEDLHITLRYLGETDLVNSIAQRLSCVAARPFYLRLGGWDAFVRRAPEQSVIWRGVQDADGCLASLRAAVDRAIEDILPLRKWDAFTPHITIAYTDERDPAEDLPEADAAEEAFFVKSFSLCRVLPAQTPPRFQTVASYLLSDQTERENVRLLCINDFHASLCKNSGGLGAAKLVRAVNDYKAEHGGTAVLFGGDNFFGDPVSERYGGAPVLDVMRAVDAEASVAGNHDFDFSVEQFSGWQREAGVPMLAANLVCRDTGEMPAFVRPYRLLRLGGRSIAVLGLALQESMEQPDRPAGWRAYALTDGVAAARKWVDVLVRGGDPAGVPDAIVALTHFGLRESSEGRLVGDELLRLTGAVPELAGAFAAHFHRFVQATAGMVAIAEGGGTGQGFAVLSLTFARGGGLLSTVPLCYDRMAQRARCAQDAVIARRIDAYFARAKREMGQPIAHVEREIHHRDAKTNAIPLTGSPLTLLAGEAMRKATGCPISLLYAGRIIGGFAQGPISLYRFYQVFAFANVIVTARLTGRRIWENIQIGMRSLPQDGASPLAVGGLRVWVDPDRPAGERVQDIRLPDGAPLEEDKTYPVVLEDYLASDPLGFRFSDAEELTYHDMTLRNIMRAELAQRGVLSGTEPDNILIQRSAHKDAGTV